MRKITILLLLLIHSFCLLSQTEWQDYTGREKAFFYQLTRKIKNLKPSVFNLLEFTDSIPYINDTLPDYPYIIKAIESDSTKLILHQTELNRKKQRVNF